MNKKIVIAALFGLVFAIGAGSADAQVLYDANNLVPCDPVVSGDMATPLIEHSDSEIAALPVNGDALPARERLGDSERVGVRVFQNGHEYADPANKGGVNPVRNLPKSQDITYR